MMGDRTAADPHAARLREDWMAVAQEQTADTELPEIVPFDPDLDDVPEDVEYGCAGVCPDFHNPDRDEPGPEPD